MSDELLETPYEVTSDIFIPCTYCCDFGDWDPMACATEITAIYNPIAEEVDLHEFLEAAGWLYMGDNGSYCPACKKRFLKTLNRRQNHEPTKPHRSRVP